MPNENKANSKKTDASLPSQNSTTNSVNICEINQSLCEDSLNNSDNSPNNDKSKEQVITKCPACGNNKLSVFLGHEPSSTTTGYCDICKSKFHVYRKSDGSH